WPETELPVITAYLDLRPQVTGNNPHTRPGQIVLRDQLREAEASLEPHTPAHDSFTADVERIDRFIEDEALPDAQGLALFNCHGEGRFETVATAISLSNDVTVDRFPRLLPLAHLADEAQAVFALADTNTLRLFASRSGELEEVGLVDDDPDDYSRHQAGGWSQARFQRHVDEHRAQFADLAAAAIDEVVTREQAEVVVLAGDEVVIPVLREKLSQKVADLVRGVVRLDMRATLDDVAAEVLPFLEVVRADDNNDAADRLVGAVRGDGMGIAGHEQTRQALEQGQVMELLIDSDADLGPDAELLMRTATLTDARIRFVDDHGGLRELGGVGALLRFRLDRAVNESPEEAEEVGAVGRLD
ncbi:MAG TPA: Vms1/Ankzf1 family peptidyl-tRNA hydrolase, partial [Candidatus Caenarcaniphilales bacterium]|nr:Vms1/Ankzf1 family peptidyl-tRNA hydrolase [Candidatus Caenarcaniphilales bacterium]